MRKRIGRVLVLLLGTAAGLVAAVSSAEAGAFKKLVAAVAAAGIFVGGLNATHVGDGVAARVQAAAHSVSADWGQFSEGVHNITDPQTQATIIQSPRTTVNTPAPEVEMFWTDNTDIQDTRYEDPLHKHLKAALAIFRDNRPTAVALQETPADSAKKIAQADGYNVVLGGNQKAIITNRRVISAQTVSFPISRLARIERVITTGSGLASDNRSMLVANLDLGNGRQLRLIDLQLSAGQADWQVIQLNTVAQYAQQSIKQGHTVLVLGDWNVDLLAALHSNDPPLRAAAQRLQRVLFNSRTQGPQYVNFAGKNYPLSAVQAMLKKGYVPPGATPNQVRWGATEATNGSGHPDWALGGGPSPSSVKFLSTTTLPNTSDHRIKAVVVRQAP